MRRVMKTVVGASFMVMFAAGVAMAQKTAPAFELSDVNGVKHTLAQYAGKIVVLEWTNYDCPFVRKFYDAGAMQAFQAKYADKGIVWLSICSSAPGKQGNFSKEEWLERIKKSGVKAAAVLLDEDGAVGNAYGAKTTPHMFVINPEGSIVYQGAIDDKRSTKAEDIPGAVNYVKASIKAIQGGGVIETPETQPYGCSVKY